MARASAFAALATLVFASGALTALAQQMGAGPADGQAAAPSYYYYQEPGDYATGGEAGGYGDAGYDPANIVQGPDGQYYYYEYVDEAAPADGQYVDPYAVADPVAMAAEYQAYCAQQQYAQQLAAQNGIIVDANETAPGEGDYVDAAYDPANIVQGPDGQYYYYYEEPAADGDAIAVEQASTFPAVPAYSAAPYNTPANMMAYLVPGADWSHNAQAVFQPEEEVPALPGEDEIDISPPGVDSTDPTFGTQQERTYQAVIEAAPLQFLRAQSVLLDKGERQIDVGFQYAITEGFLLLPQIVGVAPNQSQVISSVRARQRILLSPIELRYGLTDELQGFINVPLGWASTELSFPGFDETANEGGLGDISAGLSKVVVEGCGYGPDVIFTVAMTAPTGPADFPIVPTIPEANLGQGYWGVQASLLFIQVMDPLVVFYGAGFNHRFDATFNNKLGSFHIDPGEMFIYQFGVGFGVNESVSLSTSFLGQYITEDEINDIRVYGGILEPMRMRFAATFAQPCKIIEPFAEIGMTRDASAARIGLTITY